MGEKKLTGAALAQHEAKLAREAEEKGEEPVNPESPPFKLPVDEYSGPMVPYPFTDGGVNENAAIRAIKMAIPICPADPRPEIDRRDGTTIPNPRYTGEPNCQEAYRFNNMGRWDVRKCESLGHNPWYTEFRKTIVQDEVDADGWVIKERSRIKVETRLNVIQVTDNPRHTNRMEVPLALARGARFLSDFGIEQPCEFRNCTKPQEIRTRFGRFCGERHARLVGADFRELSLIVGGDPITEEKALEQRAQQLESINLGIK